MKRVPRLMAIGGLGAAGGLEAWTAKLARAGVDCVQIRDKTASDRSIFEACRSALAALAAIPAIPAMAAAAATMTEPHRTTLLVVNRRPDIAAAVGAAGVHLPARGLPVRLVRDAFGDNLLIGRSTHSLNEVAKAHRDGADYVVFGPVYETPEKLQFGPPRGLDELARACGLGIPVLAIGGLNEERLAEVAEAGAWGAAAIRLFDRPDESHAIVERAGLLFSKKVEPPIHA